MVNSTETKVTTFDARYLPAYIALNRAWIEKYFAIEKMDIAQLEDPDRFILNPGGEIFFILENGMAVATCAMVVHDERSFELAKMAVLESCRGKGYGDLLMKTAIEWARSKKADQVILLSNTILAPAISLYKKHQFKTVHLGEHPDYQRCNIVMELDL